MPHRFAWAPVFAAAAIVLCASEAGAQVIPAAPVMGVTRPLPGLVGAAQPTIIVGSPAISPGLSAFSAINDNTPDSPLAGVLSIYGAVSPINGVRGSGVALDRYHVLTAAHVVDFSGGLTPEGTVTGDGVADALLPNSRVYLNSIAAPDAFVIEAITMAPGWHGFRNASSPFGASNHNDLAILTLRDPLPAEVPVYPIYRTPFEQDDAKVILMTGYGYGGDEVNGITQPPSVDVKRYGWNTTTVYEPDADGSGHAALYLADFDQPAADGGPDLLHTGFDGITSLGNDFESLIAPGDSGGPAFIIDDLNNDGFVSANELTVFGLTTFTFDTAEGIWPRFGTGFGGPILSDYTGLIDSMVPEPGTLAMALAAWPVLLRRRRG